MMDIYQVAKLDETMESCQVDLLADKRVSSRAASKENKMADLKAAKTADSLVGLMVANLVQTTFEQLVAMMVVLQVAMKAQKKVVQRASWKADLWVGLMEQSTVALKVDGMVELEVDELVC